MRKNAVTQSYGIPGTEISYRKQHSWKATRRLADTDPEARRRAFPQKLIELGNNKQNTNEN